MSGKEVLPGAKRHCEVLWANGIQLVIPVAWNVMFMVVPSADWRIARQWQKTASVTVLNKSQTKDIKQIFDRGDNKCAVLKPIGSGDGVKILKELCLSTRKREGYVKFQSENGKYGFMRIVYFEALQVFMARWPEDQDTLCDSMEKLLKSIEATKKNQQFEKVIKILVCINVVKDQTRD